MPSAPDVDLYEALEVSNTASHQEIKNAYKRLALIHHPDKNPNDESATARFQRISMAHEALSDATSRARYDNRSRINPNTPTYYHRPFYASSDNYFYDEDEVQEEARKYARDERRAREDEAEAKRQAKAAEKKAEHQTKQSLKEKREKEERFHQEQLWEAMKATTEAQKQSTCLHSQFWPKEQQRKKFKCGSCGQKRGMAGYKCPHCALLACQLCLNELNSKRDYK